MLALTTNITRYKLFYFVLQKQQEAQKLQAPPCQVSQKSSTGFQSHLWADVGGSQVHSSCRSALTSRPSLICCDDSSPAPLQKQNRIRCLLHKRASPRLLQKSPRTLVKARNRAKDKPRPKPRPTKVSGNYHGLVSDRGPDPYCVPSSGPSPPWRRQRLRVPDAPFPAAGCVPRTPR